MLQKSYKTVLKLNERERELHLYNLYKESWESTKRLASGAEVHNMRYRIDVDGNSIQVCRKAYVRFHGYTVYEFERMAAAVKHNHEAKKLGCKRVNKYTDQTVLDYSADDILKILNENSLPAGMSLL